jgi:hypothetical protein
MLIYSLIAAGLAVVNRFVLRALREMRHPNETLVGGTP